MNKLISVLVVAVLAALAACSTAPPVNVTTVRNDPNANLSVIRDRGAAAGLGSFAVYDGESELGRLWPSHGMNVHLSPGVHTIAIAPVSFGIPARTVDFVKVTITDQLQTMRLFIPGGGVARLALQ